MLLLSATRGLIVLLLHLLTRESRLRTRCPAGLPLALHLQQQSLPPAPTLRGLLPACDGSLVNGRDIAGLRRHGLVPTRPVLRLGVSQASSFFVVQLGCHGVPVRDRNGQKLIVVCDSERAHAHASARVTEPKRRQGDDLRCCLAWVLWECPQQTPPHCCLPQRAGALPVLAPHSPAPL